MVMQRFRNKHEIITVEILFSFSKRIWKLNSEINNEVNQYQKIWFQNNYVIGIQMRATEGFFRDPSQVYMKFINCALEIEKDFLLKSNKKNIKWLIVSDSEKVKESIMGYTAEKTFTFNATVSANKDKFRLAVIDVELLSKCDEVIVTSGSTFGWLAAMKTLKMPYFISGSNERMVKCTREDMRHPSVNPRSTASF